MRSPRFNHVAVSVAPSLLDEHGRREIVDFYSDVFGWEELPTETIDRKRLILSAYRYDQFVFIIGDDDPMRAPRLDHFGMGVESLEDLETFLGRARAWASRDERVDLIDKKVEVHPGVTLTNFYVRFLLPLMVEVQHYRWDGGLGS